MDTKRYKVKFRYTLTGYAEIDAVNQQQAGDLIESLLDESGLDIDYKTYDIACRIMSVEQV